MLLLHWKLRDTQEKNDESSYNNKTTIDQHSTISKREGDYNNTVKHEPVAFNINRR